MRASFMLLLVLSSAASAAESPVTLGKWQMTTMIESMSMPGMPTQIRTRMMGKPMSATVCITPKEAAAGTRDVIGKSNGACRCRSFAVAADRINGVMECKTGAPTPQVTAIYGSYSPVAYDVRPKMNGGAVQSVSRTVGKSLVPG